MWIFLKCGNGQALFEGVRDASVLALLGKFRQLISSWPTVAGNVEEAPVSVTVLQCSVNTCQKQLRIHSVSCINVLSQTFVSWNEVTFVRLHGVLQALAASYFISQLEKNKSNPGSGF